jgi:hypothetical protein
MELDDPRVETLVGRLAHHVRPPAQHRVEDADDAGAEHVGAERQGTDVQALHRHDQADGGHEGADRAHERPRARIDEMVVVVLGVGLGHSVRLRPT